MGMSASQARLLSLKARQSNLEYQGQQINQARSILSQQCTALYNSLLSMTVPTPPATTDFTKIEYKGVQGSSKFTLGTITPESGGTYNVEMKYERNGHAVKGGSYGEISSYDVPEYFYGTDVSSEYGNPVKTSYLKRGDEIQSKELASEENPNGYKDEQTIMHAVTSAQSGVTTYYYQDTKAGGGFVAAKSFDDAKKQGGGQVFISTTIGAIKAKDPEYDWNAGADDYLYSAEDKGEYYEGGITKDEFNAYEFIDYEGNPLTLNDLEEVGKDAYNQPVFKFKKPAIRKDNTGKDSVKNPEYDPNEAKKVGTVGGNEVLDFTRDVLGDSYDAALKAIANSFPEYKDGGEPNGAKIAQDFSVIMKKNSAGDLVPHFIKKAEYQQQSQISNNNGQGRVEVFSLEPNGSYQEAVSTPGCKLTFDTSGRITSIDIPLKDEDGNFTGKYDTVNLEAETVTDDAAYKDAYAQYEYETYLYDQKNKEINAKTEIIQQEDKNLELKLQRLDNERTQITTEIEAVEKVINDNIEASYKSFSG